MALEDRMKYAQMKARHKQQLKAWYLKPWGIFTLIMIALFISFIIAASIYIVKAAREYNEQQLIEETKREFVRYEQAIEGDINNISFGNESAPLTVVQFTDFACPICAQTSPIILDLKENYSDKIYFIHRDFPTQENSIDLASGAHCANEQNSYWQFYEQLFSQQERFINLYDEDLYVELAKLSEELNLNTTLFAECLSEQRYLSIVANDFQDVEYLNLEGSPTWFINNHPVTGYISHDQFILLVDTLLRELY